MPIYRESIIPMGDTPKKMPLELNIKYMVSAFGGGEEITEDCLTQLQRV